MQPGQMAYDRGITVFSPDGRLFQVEYAREAVKKGTTAIGLKFDKGVILIGDKHASSRLVEPDSIQKIYMVDEHIGCATSGLVADARILVDEARKDAQIHKITYGDNVTVEGLVKKVCDFKQNYTQYGGVRPFGTGLLVAGVDDFGCQLYETDPSGALVAYKAGSIGSGRPTVMDIFEKEFEDNMTYDAALTLGLRALAAATEDELSSHNIEIGVVEKGRIFRTLDDKELEEAIGKM
ncbi:MAG: archaeal proteasome endopeptidase complex subunit alpha [Candidatus Methanomethylophilaceae archaeon]|jgi:proteasome alpha subunit|nr:proteasome subunit alpha [Methanomassiliicoccales archaeon RumEn M2]MDI9378582.1 archaeal proteasome endopeptidase complex subunit alpha [Candidatus Thermoplasmatota archaeon]